MIYYKDMHKVYITREIPESGIKILKEKGFEVKVSTLDRALTKEELINEIKKENYFALITLLNDKIDREVLEACSGVKIIANYAVGYNNIDLEAAKEKGIVISNCRGTSAQAVAEHTVGLMLSVLNRIAEGDRFTRAGKWEGWDPALLLGKDLFGKTVGLIGTGNIGQMVAKTLVNGFNCKIIYTDMVVNGYMETELGAKKVSQEELLRTSDIVSLHVPLLPETIHLINAENLKLMRPLSILINTARGPVVDENALLGSLKNKEIYGAGLDVFEFEPKIASELLALENVVLTPHIASAKESARHEMATCVAENVVSMLENGVAVTEVK